MKRALLATLLIALPLAGCRCAIVPLPNGKTAIVASLLTDPQLSHIEVKADGSLLMDGYNSTVNADATKAVVSGAVEGFLRTWRP